MQDDDRVGYRTPPKRHRFKPGTSGNPRGRLKNTRDQALKELLRNELRSEMMVTVNGKQKKLRKEEVLVKNLVKKAIEIDPVALKTLGQITNGFTDDMFGAAQHDFRMTSEGQRLLEEMDQEIRSWRLSTPLRKPSL